MGEDSSKRAPEFARTVKEWEHAGLHCVVEKLPDVVGVPGAANACPGHHCGYVELPAGSGLPLDSYKIPRSLHAAAWGGEITFAGRPGFTDEGRWYGFDMGHAFDFAPSRATFTEDAVLHFGTYLHDDADAIRVTEEFAEAIAEHLGVA